MHLQYENEALDDSLARSTASEGECVGALDSAHARVCRAEGAQSLELLQFGPARRLLAGVKVLRVARVRAQIEARQMVRHERRLPPAHADIERQVRRGQARGEPHVDARAPCAARLIGIPAEHSTQSARNQDAIRMQSGRNQHAIRMQSVGRAPPA